MISRNFLEVPLPLNSKEGEGSALTMVLDKGLGLNELEDLLQIAANYIDYIKLTFGTAFLYPEDVLREKVLRIREAEVEVYTGGTLFEIAIEQNKMEKYFRWLEDMNFSAVEISDGTINLDFDQRKKAIEIAKRNGFKVLSEVGKKEKEKTLSVNQMLENVNFDFEAGADKVIIEARASGKNISIYNKQGDPNLQSFFELKKNLFANMENIIWEAPLKKQQLFFINQIGNNVNLGNIATDDVIALAALRRGLRGDTFSQVLK